jgi:hypothetical protein
MVPFRNQWTNRQFRNSNQLMELMFTALADPRNSKGINWLLRVWRQIDKTLLMVLGKTPCEPQEEGASHAHQTTKENLLPEMRGQMKTPQSTKLCSENHEEQKEAAHQSSAKNPARQGLERTARKNVPIHLTSVH